MTQAPVDVRFLDADSQLELMRAPLAPSALPERLVAPRRIEWRGEPYAVVSARPPTRDLAIDLGRIEVSLRRVPDGLFTLPTLAEELPRPDLSAVRQGRLLQLDGDEWTQIECYGAQAAPRVTEQLARVEAVRKEQRQDGFYPRLHIRGQLGPLLKDVALSVEEVARMLPAGALRLDGVLIEGEPGLVKDAFAFQTMNGLEVYGLAPRGAVKVLALRPPAVSTPLHEETMALSMLLLQHGLRVVDWVGARTAARAEELESLLAV